MSTIKYLLYMNSLAMFLLALRASSFGIAQKYAPPFCILTTVMANKKQNTQSNNTGGS